MKRVEFNHKQIKSKLDKIGDYKSFDIPRNWFDIPIYIETWVLKLTVAHQKKLTVRTNDGIKKQSYNHIIHQDRNMHVIRYSVYIRYIGTKLLCTEYILTTNIITNVDFKKVTEYITEHNRYHYIIINNTCT